MRTGTALLLMMAVMMAVMIAGCGGGTHETAVPRVAAPSQVVSGDDDLTGFGGTWASGSEGSGVSVGTCTQLQWQLPNAGTTGTGRFEATCNGVQLAGTVTVAISRASMLAWRVGGRTTQSGRPCEYSLTGTATLARPDGMRVDYSGTVCGAPVNGSHAWYRS